MLEFTRPSIRRFAADLIRHSLWQPPMSIKLSTDDKLELEQLAAKLRDDRDAETIVNFYLSGKVGHHALISEKTFTTSDQTVIRSFLLLSPPGGFRIVRDYRQHGELLHVIDIGLSSSEVIKIIEQIEKNRKWV